MKRQRLVGWLSIILGIVFIILAVHSMHEFAMEKGLMHDVKRFFTQNPLWNPLIKFFGGTPQVLPPQHDSGAIITQIFGIILIALGGIAVYLSRKKRR